MQRQQQILEVQYTAVERHLFEPGYRTRGPVDPDPPGSGVEARWTGFSLRIRSMRCVVGEIRPPVLEGKTEALDLYA
jgi:hypothetical protein